MSNNYLENVIHNMEFLDWAKKKGIQMTALAQMPDKETALENLKLLQGKLPESEYRFTNEIKTVSVAVLTNRRVVETINQLTVDDALNSSYIKLFGKYLESKWEFEPDIMAACLKKYILSTEYQESSCSAWDLRFLYLLLQTGHERLIQMLYTGRYRNEVRQNILKEYINADRLEQDSDIEKYFILEQLPDDFDVSDETSRICSFPEILRQPGAMDIYVSGKGHCEKIMLDNHSDYTDASRIVKETLKKMNGIFLKNDSDAEWILDQYFAKASYVKFDKKLLNGFLQNISGFDEEKLSKAVATNACFLAVCTGNRYTRLINRIYESENSSDTLAEIALQAIKEHKKSFLRLMEEHLELFLKLPFSSIFYYYRDTFWNLCNVNTLQKTDIETLLKKDKEEKYLYTKNTASFEYLNGTFTFGELAVLSLQPAWIRKIYSSFDSTIKVDEKLRRIRQLFHGGITGNNLSNEGCEVAGCALSEESFEQYCSRRHIERSSKNDMFHLMVKEKENVEIISLADSAKTGMDVTIILRNLMKPELFALGLEKFKHAFTDLDEDSKWLKEKLEIPEEYAESFMNFCLKGNASIVHDYYEDQGYNHTQQAENILLLAKAEIYGNWMR